MGQHSAWQRVVIKTLVILKLGSINNTLSLLQWNALTVVNSKHTSAERWVDNSILVIQKFTYFSQISLVNLGPVGKVRLG